MKNHYFTKYVIMTVLFTISTTLLWAADRTVAPGGNIQRAINTVASSGGGTVTLAAGVHTITEPVRMKSNVTLQGEGNWDSLLKTSLNIQIIIADGNSLENLTVQNLAIEGTNALNGGGIQIVSFGRDHDTVKVLNVHCYNTGWGVHIKGAKNVLIKDCLFEKNGTAGKEGFAHNLYLRRVYDAEVRDSKFLNSTSANGINISYSEDIKVYNCEMSGNYFRGVRAANTDGYLVHDCIVTNNGNVGILANSEGVPTTNIDIRRNCVSNNEDGIKGVNGVTGVVRDNNSYGNDDDYSIPNSVNQSGNISDSNIECNGNSPACVANPSYIEAECYSSQSGVRSEPCSEGGLNIGYINNGDWMVYNDVDLTNAKLMNARVASNFTGGVIEVRLEGTTGTLIGTIPVSNTGGNQTWLTLNTRIESVTGNHNVYLVFKGGNGYLFNINYFGFSEATLSTNKNETVTVNTFPNPVMNTLHINNAQTLAIEIYNSLGQLQYESKVLSDTHKVDMSAFSSGLYFLKTFDGKTSEIQKIIKQ